ncbi:MAG: M56 family metallopeptidase [Firmicutes bacterium]|nr:M56 family metallopeptidase [Bacillota bacterium]
MEMVFQTVLGMSLTACIAISIVCLARYALKKAPRALSYVLWAVVLFRLLCPLSLPSPISLIPQQVSLAASRWSDTVTLNSHFEIRDIPGNTDSPAPEGKSSEDIVMEAEPVKAALSLPCRIWLAGVAAMGAYILIAGLHIRRKTAAAIPVGKQIFLADGIRSPFVLGIFRPRIYLPAGLTENEQAYILLHEKQHIARLDYVVKMLAFLALSIHWFNPMVWLAFSLSAKDMEMCCDEAVIRKMGDGIRADYCTSLLSLAAGRRNLMGIPLTFGGNAKCRIRNLAVRKKAGIGVISMTLVFCILLSACLATNPVPDSATLPPETTLPSETAVPGTVSPEDIRQETERFEAEKAALEAEKAALEAKLLEDWRGPKEQSYSLKVSLLSTPEMRNESVPEFSYQGGELHLRVSVDPRNVNETGILLFLNGKPQTYRVQVPDDEPHSSYKYLHIFSQTLPVRASYDLYFIPNTGDPGDLLSMQVVCLSEPNFFLEDGITFCKYTGMISTANANVRVLESSGSAGNPLVTSRVLSVSQKTVELTQSESAMLESRDLAYELPYRLTIHGKVGDYGKDPGGMMFYGYTAHEPLEVTFEVFGDPRGEYGLNLFVNNLPVSDGPVADITMEEGKKTVVTVLLDLSDYQGSVVLYGFLAAKNFDIHGESGAVWSLWETETCYFTSAEDIYDLLGITPPND